MITHKKTLPERKIVSVTGKRQVTIPIRFFEKLRLGKEVECVLTEEAILLRPLSNSENVFTMEILKDLVSQGYAGDELLEKFTEQRINIDKAIKMLANEADEIAKGRRKGATTEDIFGRN